MLGTSKLDIKHRDKTYSVDFIVADTQSPPILGLDTSLELNLIKRVQTINTLNLPCYLEKYADCFQEIGKLNITHHIVVDQNLQPVINPPRRPP